MPSQAQTRRSSRLTERELRALFHARYDIDLLTGCWEWNRNVERAGYGTMRWGDRTRKAHQLAYELAYGSIPVGMAVLHRCDNRRCVNPAHLFVGTWADNARDREHKGRGGNHKGVLNGRAKLTPDLAAQIRLEYPAVPFGDREAYAKKLGVTFGMIYHVLHGRNWVA